MDPSQDLVARASDTSVFQLAGLRSFQRCSSPEVRSTERSEPVSLMGDYQDMREDEEDFFGEEDFEGSEEAKELPNVIPKCHKKPTVSEIVAYNRSHTPYRSWCKHCVAGRAPNLPHRPRRPDQGILKNEIAADYCVLRNAARDVSQPVLVAHDRRTGIYIAHAVPFKGAGVEWIACGMCESVGTTAESYSGRMASLRSWTSWLRSPDSGETCRLSNGFVERAIQPVEDMIRTHKLALEEKIGEVLKVDTAAMVADRALRRLLNKSQQGKDVRTPCERSRGKQFSGSMLEFGSQVMLKVLDKVSGGVMQERWVEGTWLGNQFTTLEHLVARKSDGVVVRTRAVRDLPKPPTVEDLDRIIGHPHAPPEPEEHRPATAPDPSRPIPRAVYITRAMLERHGYSERCQRCNAMRRGQTYGTGGHSADCRRRMEAALAQDEEYQFKVEHANFRKDQYVEKRVRAQKNTFLVQVIRNFLRAELKVTKMWRWRLMKRKRHHLVEKVANDLRKEVRAQRKGRGGQAQSR